jgi:beta-N-acetylhexosaminidase
MPEMSRTRLVAAAAAVVLLVAVGIGLAVSLSGGDGSPASPRARSESASEQQASFLSRLIPAARELSAAARGAPPHIAALAARMSVERKVAQLFLLGFAGQDLTDPVFERLRALGLGGIVIDRPNYVYGEQLASLAGEATAIADEAGHVAPWVMAPQEGGAFNAFPDLPPATAAADLRSDAQAFRESREAGRTLRALGVNGVLAPVVDVGPPDGLAVGARAYSDDPRDVAAYATAVVDAHRAVPVLTAAGHFPGLGSGTADTRQGVSQVGSTLAALRRRDLVPFRAAIRAGVPAIVVGHGLYATDDFVTPASLSREVVTGLLRRELGFEGIAMTDDLADPAVTALRRIPAAAVAAVRAGADLLYVSGPPSEQQAAYAAVLEAVRGGRIGADRLEEAVLRSLSGKDDYGLIE